MWTETAERVTVALAYKYGGINRVTLHNYTLHSLVSGFF